MAYYTGFVLQRSQFDSEKGLQFKGFNMLLRFSIEAIEDLLKLSDLNLNILDTTLDKDTRTITFKVKDNSEEILYLRYSRDFEKPGIAVDVIEKPTN